MNDRIDEIKTKWNFDVTLPMAVPWGKDDVVWLVGEVERLRAKAERADEEATKLANSDLATTEQVIRALRVENERLRAALADIARGDYSDPFCMKTPEQRAREALAPKKEKP
jgi:hypothetical protein